MAVGPGGRGLGARHGEERRAGRAAPPGRDGRPSSPWRPRERLPGLRAAAPLRGEPPGRSGAFPGQTGKVSPFPFPTAVSALRTELQCRIRPGIDTTRKLELVEPSGWIHVPLTDTHKKPIRTFMIQIAVLANHQNGRDTHMRQIKVYTPVEESSIGKFPRCTTIDFMMYRSIR
ncbi:anaphase-promoting complex subunit 10 isoform 4-T10 [Sylvia borin]